MILPFRRGLVTVEPNYFSQHPLESVLQLRDTVFDRSVEDFTFFASMCYELNNTMVTSLILFTVGSFQFVSPRTEDELFSMEFLIN